MCDYCMYPLVARSNFYNILEDNFFKKNLIYPSKKKKKKLVGYTEINILITNWPNSVIEYSQEGKSF